MFVPEDGSAALPMMFLLLIVWGSWPSCRKMSGSGNIEFEVCYVLTQFVLGMLLCVSFGMAAIEDTRHFSGALFTDVLRTELQLKPGATGLSILAGVSLCIGDFVMACAIDLLGVTVACPVGFGIPLTLGSTLNYVIEPKADPRLLFPGIVCCVLGMLLDTASHASRKKELPTATAPPEPAVPTTTGQCKGERASGNPDRETPVHKFPGIVCCILGMLSGLMMGAAPHANRKEELPAGMPPELEVPSEKGGEVSGAPDGQSWNWKLLLVPILGGSCCAAAGAISTAAAAMGKLDPYVILFAFMIGQLMAVLPMLCIYTMIAQPKPLSGLSPVQLPRAILERFVAVSRKSPRSTLWNAMAGFCTGSGWFLFHIGTPVVSRAVGFIFGCSSPLTCIFFGVFIFREFDGQPFRPKACAALATLAFAAAMTLMTVASV